MRRAFIAGPYRVRVARGESEALWRDRLSDLSWLADAPTLKQERESWVKRTRVGERSLIVKRRAVPGGVRGLWQRVKLRAGGGRLARQWRGALWLTRHGFPTARPVAIATRTGVRGGEEILVLEDLGGRSLLEHLAARDLTVRQEHALAKVIGVEACRMLALGSFNRDHKPSNLIVTCTDPQCAEVAIIDTAAIRRLSLLGDERGERMLASLVIESIGTGCTPRRTLMMRTLHGFEKGASLEDGGGDSTEARAYLHGLWRRVARIIEAHGDPRPRTDPLTPAPAGPSAGRPRGNEPVEPVVTLHRGLQEAAASSSAPPAGQERGPGLP